MTVPPSHEFEHVPPDEVLQHDEENPPRLAPVSVITEGIVLTKDVGAQEWSGTYYSVGATNPVQIAQPQPARSRMVVYVGAGAVWLGRTEAEARAKSGLKTPATASQVVMHHREELWALSDSGNVDVSVYQEFAIL